MCSCYLTNILVNVIGVSLTLYLFIYSFIYLLLYFGEAEDVYCYLAIFIVMQFSCDKLNALFFCFFLPFISKQIGCYFICAFGEG